MTVILFNNVINSKEIKNKLIEGKIEAAFINPKLIIDILQVLIAINKVFHSETYHLMKTKSIYSEILYSLSPSKNITNSLKTFGINESDTEILVVILNDENDEKLQKIIKEVQGTQVDINFLHQMKDESLIIKTYGIKDAELNVGSILDSIVTRISVKDYT